MGYGLPVEGADKEKRRGCRCSRTSFDAPASADTLVSLVHHEDPRKWDATWAALEADPEGTSALKTSEAGRPPAPAAELWDHAGLFPGPPAALRKVEGPL